MTSVGLTNTDLSNIEPLRNCRCEFERADTDTKLAAWARRWGRAAVEEIEEPAEDRDGELTKELNEVEEKYNHLHGAASRTLSEVDAVLDLMSDKLAVEKINDALAGLDNAL